MPWQQPMRCVVLGKVLKPGQIPLRGNDTLREICNSADVRSDGLKQIVVIRAVDMEAGNDNRETFDLGPSGIPDIPVFDGDVVYLSEDARGQFLWKFNPLPFYYDRILFAI